MVDTVHILNDVFSAESVEQQVLPLRIQTTEIQHHPLHLLVHIYDIHLFELWNRSRPDFHQRLWN